ncbi:hypothetical protein V6N13_042615 [Hibiscus sabdariffa]
MPGNNPNAMPQHNQNNFYADPRNNQDTWAEYREKNDTTMQNLAASAVTLRSGRQCEAECSAKQAVQNKGKEPVDESPAKLGKAEDKNSNIVRKDSANEQVDAKQQLDANRTLAKPAEPAYVYPPPPFPQDYKNISS